MKKNIYIFRNNEMILEQKTLEDTLNEFAPLIDAVVNSIYYKLNCIYSFKDLLQNANLEFIYIYNRYDYKFNVSFNHFVKKSLFLSLYSKTLRELDKNNTCSVGQNNDINEINKLSEKEMAFDDIEFRISMQKNFNYLQQKVIQYTLMGLTQYEISSKMEISQSKVSRTLKEIKKVLCNTLNEVM